MIPKLSLRSLLCLGIGTLALSGLVSCGSSNAPSNTSDRVITSENPPELQAAALPNDPTRPKSVPDTRDFRPPPGPNRSTARTLRTLSTGPVLYPPHDGGSPFSFDKFGTPSDKFIVNDQDSSTLNYYLLRDEGPIVVDINVYKNVGDIDTLLKNGLISPTADIILPAFDVDVTTDPIDDCDGDGIKDQLRREVDDVYWNGKKIGTLSGADQIWKVNRFSVPIRDVRFPSSKGGVGTNRLEIRIDQANKDIVTSSGKVGCLVWAAALDWVALKFNATSPVVIIPGFGGLNDPNLTAYADLIRNQTGLPANNIAFTTGSAPGNGCFDPFGAAQKNTDDLRSIIKREASLYATSGLHLIGYSKGGLDSVLLLNSLQQKPEYITVGKMSGQDVLSRLQIKSLATHGAPFLGTVIADAALSNDILKYTTRPPDPPFPLIFWASSAALGTNVCLLNTEWAPLLSGAGSYGVPSFTIAVDADKNGDGVITTSDEATVLGKVFIANNFYGLLRNTSEISGGYPFSQYIRTSTPQLNDTIVTVRSAQSLIARAGGQTFIGKDGADHGNVAAKPFYQQKVIEQGLSGVLQWRLR